MSPLEFLNMLWNEKPADLFVLIWTLLGKRSQWFRDVGTAAKFVAARGSDVYVGVGLTKQDYGPLNRCPSDKVAGIAGLWADFDLRSEAHAKKPLPATIEEALSLIPADLSPTFIIVTGNGVHAWWLFKESWIFANEDERKEAAALSYRFQTLFHYQSTQRGWTFDRLPDLARLLRIPGTINAKDPKKPKPVEVYSVEGRRYDRSDFHRYLDDLSIPDQEAEQRAAKATARRFVDHPLVINLEAAIPDEMLARWMKRDLRFRNTWNRKRDDLHDDSQSGYDMALADFGVAASLTDQQITDLIIHHRHIHGQERRTRLDYFQRTISKARRTAGPGVSFAGAPPEPPPPPTDNENLPAPDNGAGLAARRAMLCQHISQILRIRLLRLVKVTGKEPVFLMQLEEGRIEFSDAGKLISQRVVRTALAGRTGKLIPSFKPKAWEELAQMLLDACTIEQGTDDMELEGEARFCVDQYLSDTQFIASPAGQPVHSRLRPMVQDGKIAISAKDLQMYTNKMMTQTLTLRAVAAMLAALGGKQVRVRGNGFKEQSRWALPVDEFDPKDYQQHQEDARGDE